MLEMVAFFLSYVNRFLMQFKPFFMQIVEIFISIFFLSEKEAALIFDKICCLTTFFSMSISSQFN